MKTTLSVILQVVLFAIFLAIFIGVSLLDPFQMRWFITHPTLSSTRWFVPDGLLVMTAIYLIVLAVEAGARKIRTAGLGTTIAYILALVIGLVARFGFVTRDLY